MWELLTPFLTNISHRNNNLELLNPYKGIILIVDFYNTTTHTLQVGIDVAACATGTIIAGGTVYCFHARNNIAHHLQVSSSFSDFFANLDTNLDLDDTSDNKKIFKTISTMTTGCSIGMGIERTLLSSEFFISILTATVDAVICGGAFTSISYAIFYFHSQHKLIKHMEEPSEFSKLYLLLEQMFHPDLPKMLFSERIPWDEKILMIGTATGGCAASIGIKQVIYSMLIGENNAPSNQEEEIFSFN